MLKTCCRCEPEKLERCATSAPATAVRTPSSNSTNSCPAQAHSGASLLHICQSSVVLASPGSDQPLKPKPAAKHIPPEGFHSSGPFACLWRRGQGEALSVAALPVESVTKL